MFIRVRLALARTALRLSQSMTGLRLVEDTDPEDVFIIGFPRSGHTWMQYLLAGLVGGVDTSNCADALVQELVPDVQDRLAYRRYTQPVFFKSHHLPRPAYRRVVYLLRDGRDAMVSYFHHYNALNPPVDFPTLIRKAPRLEARWHEHVERWHANPYGAAMITVRYEDLKRAPVDGLRRVAEFAGVPTTDGQLQRAVAGAAFEQQQKREATRGWEHRNWPKDQRFVRRGTVGSHRDEMPADARALFTAEAGATLQKYGYESA